MDEKEFEELISPLLKLVSRDKNTLVFQYTDVSETSPLCVGYALEIKGVGKERMTEIFKTSLTIAYERIKEEVNNGTGKS